MHTCTAGVDISSSAAAAEQVGCVEQQGGEAAHQHDTEGDEEDPVARPPGPRPQPRPRTVTQLAPAAADPDTLGRGEKILFFPSNLLWSSPVST